MSHTNHGLKCQSQNRLQPLREVAATKAKNKLSSALQYQVFSQCSIGEQNDMMVKLAANKQKEYNVKVKLAATKDTKKISSALQNWGYDGEWPDCCHQSLLLLL